jgi:hypothetical protein
MVVKDTRNDRVRGNARVLKLPPKKAVKEKLLPKRVSKWSRESRHSGVPLPDRFIINHPISSIGIYTHYT